MPTTPQVQEGLDAIAKAVQDVQASERAMYALVTITKLRGATWQQIGDVLGVSRQSAQERFGEAVALTGMAPLDPPKPAGPRHRPAAPDAYDVRPS